MRGQYCDFRPDEELVIGRVPEFSQMVIPGYGGIISRQHLRVKYDGTAGQFIVKDLNSTNKTWINGHSILPDMEYRFSPGTELELSLNGCRILLGVRIVRTDSFPWDT